MSSEKIFILYPGVDTNTFYPANVSDFKNELYLSSRKVLLTVGRLDKRKGHDNVIRALPAIIREIPNIIYLIVGEGDQRKALDVLVKDLNVQDYVKFLGYVSNKDLAKFYNLCDLFIMANRELEDGDTEGFGMVFIEANACGSPVIGGRCGGVIEAIEDNVTGLMVDPYSVDDIESKIIFLMKNESIAKDLGEKGLKRVIDRFKWEENLKTNINIFRERFLN